MRSGGLALLLLTGCAPLISLDRVVVAYDRTTANNMTKQILLNIARARHNEPIHFTSISSITATYKFAFSAGIGPAITGDKGYLPLPSLGGSTEENPTFSIAPMQGEEFTQRLLTPFHEQKLTLLLRQGYDVDALLRLLGSEVRLADATGALTVHYNRPSNRDGYIAFRRVVAHLSSIQDRHALHVEPLHYQYTWTVPADSVTPESYHSTFKDYAAAFDEEKQVYRISKRINGRVMITNYDPAVLSNDERFRLHEEADEVPFNDVLIDIRAGHPGGEFPMHGSLRLRSFHEILNFIGRGIEEEPEFYVPSDPRTGKIAENPAHTLEILESRRSPRGAGLSVDLRGAHYTVKPQKGYQWNQKAFSLLCQLFQMTVSGATPAGPLITISK